MTKRKRKRNAKTSKSKSTVSNGFSTNSAGVLAILKKNGLKSARTNSALSENAIDAYRSKIYKLTAKPHVFIWHVRPRESLKQARKRLLSLIRDVSRSLPNNV